MNNVIDFRARVTKVVNSLSQTIVKQMNALEYKENNMLHYFNSDLEKRAWEAIDSKNRFKMDQIIKEFDRLL